MNVITVEDKLYFEYQESTVPVHYSSGNEGGDLDPLGELFSITSDHVKKASNDLMCEARIINIDACVPGALLNIASIDFCEGNIKCRGLMLTNCSIGRIRAASDANGDMSDVSCVNVTIGLLEIVAGSLGLNEHSTIRHYIPPKINFGHPALARGSTIGRTLINTDRGLIDRSDGRPIILRESSPPSLIDICKEVIGKEGIAIDCLPLDVKGNVLSCKKCRFVCFESAFCYRIASNIFWSVCNNEGACRIRQDTLSSEGNDKLGSSKYPSFRVDIKALKGSLSPRKMARAISPRGHDKKGITRAASIKNIKAMTKKLSNLIKKSK